MNHLNLTSNNNIYMNSISNDWNRVDVNSNNNTSNCGSSDYEMAITTSLNYENQDKDIEAKKCLEPFVNSNIPDVIKRMTVITLMAEGKKSEDEAMKLEKDGFTDHAEKLYLAARQCFQEAFELRGDPKSKTCLAFYFLKGKGGPKNVDYAVDLLTQSSNEGHSRGQINLAKILEARKNIPEARKWYRKAAEAGYPQAITRMQKFESDDLLYNENSFTQSIPNNNAIIHKKP